MQDGRSFFGRFEGVGQSAFDLIGIQLNHNAKKIPQQLTVSQVEQVPTRIVIQKGAFSTIEKIYLGAVDWAVKLMEGLPEPTRK